MIGKWRGTCPISISLGLMLGFLQIGTGLVYVPWSKVAILGMVIPPLIGNPYNGYINPYYWVDDHPLLYGNNGSLDPSTYILWDLLATLITLRIIRTPPSRASINMSAVVRVQSSTTNIGSDTSKQFRYIS